MTQKKNLSHLFTSGVLAAAAMSQAAYGQNSTIIEEETEQIDEISSRETNLEAILETATTDQIKTVTGGPLNRATGGTDAGEDVNPNFEISSIDGNAVGVISLAWGKPVSKIGQSANDYEYSYGQRTFAAKLTVPFNDLESSPFVDFKNIGDDAVFEFSYTGYSLSGKTGPDVGEAMLRVARTCLLVEGRRWLIANPGQEDLVTQVLNVFDSDDTEARYIFRIDKLNDLGSNNFAKHANELCKSQRRDEGDTRAPVNRQSLIRDYGAEAFGSDYRNLKKALFGSGVTLWGLSGSAAFERYEILNPTDITLLVENRVGFEIEGYVGKISADGDKSIRLSGSFARGYEAEDPVERCISVTAGSEQCVNGLLMSPERSDKFYASLEGRLILDRNAQGQPTIAIAPSVTYDTDDNEFLVEVPLYLQQADDGGLDAGVKVNYSSERNDIAIGLFFGVPLKRLF